LFIYYYSAISKLLIVFSKSATGYAPGSFAYSQVFVLIKIFPGVPVTPKVSDHIFI
jgi:hypothetical protein